MKVPNALTRDDTEHGVYYYLASEVDAALAERDAEIGRLPQAQAELLTRCKTLARERDDLREAVLVTDRVNDELQVEINTLAADKGSNTIAFLAMRESRDALKDRCNHSEAWESNAKRLALELECLLMSCDLPAASKWWDSAHEAMELHRQLIADIYKDIEAKS